MKQLFSFYSCHTSYCKSTYAVMSDVIDEPLCSVCGGYYFTHIKDIEVDLGEVDVNAEVQMEKERLTQGGCDDELCSA